MTDTDTDTDLLRELAADLRGAFGAAAASVSLLSTHGPPLVVCTPPELEPLEQLQLRSGLGPLPAVLASAQAVVVPDVVDRAEVWPDYTRATQVVGISSALVTPLLDDRVPIGALGLYGTTPRDHGAAEIRLAALTADLLARLVLRTRSLRTVELRARQLQSALDSRILIEQAKGIVAAQRQVDVSTAFELLRSAARSSSTSLVCVARLVVDDRGLRTDRGPLPPTVRS